MKKGIKNFTTIVTTLALILSATACGGETAPTTDEVGTTNADSEELTEIIWQYPSDGNIGEGFNEMEDALNEIMKERGVKVVFEPVPLMESQKQATLMISGGEQLDVCLTAFTSIAPLVSSGQILPLDDLLEKEGQKFMEVAGESGVQKGAFGDSIYGISPIDRTSTAYGFAAKTKFLEKYNIEIDPDKIYTAEEIGEIFATIKEGEGDNFYCTIPWNTEPAPWNDAYLPYDRVTGSLSGGVLMQNEDMQNSTIENIFATDEYAEYANVMYDWAQKGYIAPDASINTEATTLLLESDSYLGNFYWDIGTSTELDLKSTTGEDFTILKTVDTYRPSNGGSVILWSIPITSANPEKAMAALDELHSNPEATKIIMYGLEGKTYEVLDKTDEGELIRYLAEDTSQLPYYNPYGLWGNILEWPALAPNPINRNEIIKEFDASVSEERISPAHGYRFIPDTVSAQIAAVETVISQYTPIINSGALNPEEVMPEFLSALESAGINKIVEENQKQYDAWLAQK